MKKWNKKTVGGQQWPEKGTFDVACCEEVEVAIRYHKTNDSSNKCVGKRQKEKEVLEWFMQEGKEYRQSVKTMRELVNAQDKKQEADKGKGEAGNEWLGPRPDPPPYPGGKNPFRAGQFPVTPTEEESEEEGGMILTGEMELKPISGTLSIKMEKTKTPTGERERGSDRLERCLSLESVVQTVKGVKRLLIMR